MSHQELLEERLVDWSLKRQAGLDPSVEDLCKDHPELAAELSILISQLKQMDWLEEDGSLDDCVPQSSDADQLDEYAETRLQNSTLNTEEFCERLIASELMTAQQVHQLRQQMNPVNGTTFADKLVKELKLTRFQATVLLEERNQPLVLDRYHILDKIGAGGMGVVYKALHRKMDRIVALKILPQSAVDTPDKVKRFQREVEAVAKLEHLNIVTAHDAHTSKGIHFLVMSYVAGSDLAAIVCSQGALPIAQGVNCVVQAARGLVHAHHKGIIHRDIKPGNLLLDNKGVVKVLDLGLARIDQLGLQAPSEQPEDLTHSGMVMGTIAYLAPEQALDTHSADARSDIYSLGCTLFYLLTGKTPFTADTAMKTMLAHREGKIPSLHAQRSEVSPELDSIFQKMIAKRPEDRFQSMEEVISAFEDLEIPEQEDVHQISQVASPSSGDPAIQDSPALHETDKFQETSIQIIVDNSPHRKRSPARSNRSWIIGGGVGVVILLAGMLIKSQVVSGTQETDRDPPNSAAAEVKSGTATPAAVTANQANESPADANAAKTAEDQQKQPNTLIASGEGNFGLQFDGVDDYVDLGEKFRFDTAEPLTLEAWVRFDGNTRFKSQTIFGGQPHRIGLHDGKTKWEYLVRDNPYAGGGIQAMIRSRINRVSLGQVNHVAGVWQGNQKGRFLKLYIDGDLVGLFELSAPLVFEKDSGVINYLGMETLYKSKPYGAFRGVLDEVRISKVARYDENFTPVTRFEVDEHTLALYHFDKGTGEVVKDSSGNDHHGTIHGAKWYHHP